MEEEDLRLEIDEDDIEITEFEIDIDEEDVEPETSDPEEIKRKLRIIEEELDNLSDIEWIYAKRLLKYGVAAWIFGIAAFISALMIFYGPDFFTATPATAYSLLILAGAAPVILSVIFIRRYRKEMEKLDGIREKLLSDYEKALLDKVEDNIA